MKLFSYIYIFLRIQAKKKFGKFRPHSRLRPRINKSLLRQTRQHEKLECISLRKSVHLSHAALQLEINCYLVGMIRKIYMPRTLVTSVSLYIGFKPLETYFLY